MTVPKVMTDMGDGNCRFVELAELLEGMDKPQPPTGPDPQVLFQDRFSSLSIDNAWGADSKARWIDAWDRWHVRHLKDNHDLAWKVHQAGKTHQIMADGLALRALRKETKPGMPYTAGMISTERSFGFRYGRVDVDMTVTHIGPGMHFSLWLLPVDGTWPPEVDMLELIGSNKFAPNGPVNLLFFNTLGGGPGIQWHEVPVDYIKARHRYSWVWNEQQMIWLVDGEIRRTQPNFIKKDLYFLATWEVGASPNGDFPGPVTSNTAWPGEVILHEVKVTR